MIASKIRQQTADSRQKTTDSKQQTADSRQQTADREIVTFFNSLALLEEACYKPESAFWPGVM
jgi:hypothetical protein